MGQNGADPIDYPHRMGFSSNTGILSGFDLNNDGITAAPGDIGSASYANDSWGFGFVPRPVRLRRLFDVPDRR